MMVTFIRDTLLFVRCHLISREKNEYSILVRSSMKTKETDKSPIRNYLTNYGEASTLR